MFLIYGDDDFLVKKEITKIIKSQGEKKLLIFNQDSALIDIVNEISVVDLFDSQKIIVIKNLTLLDSKKNDDKVHQKQFIELLQQRDPSIEIIFMQTSKIAKTTNDLTKFLFTNSQVVEVKKMQDKDLPKFIKSIVEAKGGTISLSDATSLCSKLPNDTNVIITEIERLILENRKITYEMIVNSGTHFSNEDPFEFINHFTSMDSRGVIESLQNQISKGESIINLIGQISQMLIICSRVHTLMSLSYTKMQMENYLKIHPYRIRVASEFLDRLGYQKVSFLIEKLAQLDSDIKSGKINELTGFNNFVLIFFK